MKQNKNAGATYVGEIFDPRMCVLDLLHLGGADLVGDGVVYSLCIDSFDRVPLMNCMMCNL